MQDQLSEIHPQLVLSPSKRARKVALRLDTKERVIKLVLPRRYPRRKALAFARDHARWIEKKLAALPSPVVLADGAEIPVFGTQRTICVTCYDSLKRTDITLKDNRLLVSTNRKDPSTRIVRFLKRQVRAELQKLAGEKAARINKTVNKISVRDTKSRWGSCSENGNLSFSWRLIFAPYETLDYLVAHEVAHLKHLDHSKAFWAVCRDLSADYRAGKRWIKQNGHELMKYGH